MNQQSSKKPKPPALKSSNLHELELAGAKFVKPTKDGAYEVRKDKKTGTHKIEITPTSTLAVPVKRWPKPPKNFKLPDPIGAQPEEPARPDDHSWHPAIPAGATWVQYIAGSVALMLPIAALDTLRGFRGQIRFGKLRYDEDFVCMMPGEEGNVTSWKDGRTAFAEGNDPATLKQKEKAAAERAERLANPPAHVKEAFAKQAERRKAVAGPQPGDAPGIQQNGVKKPKEGSTVASIWAACDELAAKLARQPVKAEVAAKLPALNPGTVGTQFSAWRRFHATV